MSNLSSKQKTIRFLLRKELLHMRKPKWAIFAPQIEMAHFPYVKIDLLKL
jgi:hypothetical protein